MDPKTTSQTATVAVNDTASSTPRLITSIATGEGRFVSGTLIAGRYRVISLLGRGGMGEVYRATDLTLAQAVALKFLPDTGHEFERTLDRFHNEVRIARQVSHPNVCRVYDLGEVDGMPYISMEYVDGEDLESLLHRIGRLPADKALEIARKICAGVAAAHDKGVIHRDLKPANIMLDKRGNVVVMDFGLAAVADQLHGPEARSGTPAYMAPEQLRGEEVTSKSDLYSLGLVLYELFTGKRAYEAKTQAELIRMQESSQIASMSSVAADIDPAVEKTIRRCLDSDPAKRPATALSIAASLPGGDPLAAALAAGETPSPELVAASGRTEGLPLKWSVPLAAGLAALIIAIPFVRHNAEMHSFVNMDLSPEALVAKVREHAARFGYTTRPADSAYDLRWDWSLLSQAPKHAKTRDQLKMRFEGEPPLQLGYRQSPLLLLAYPDGEINEERPSITTSGMIETWVNSKGELRRFLATPTQTDSAPATTNIDRGKIGEAVGFDLTQWQETTPRWTPLFAFDAQQAWHATHPALGVDVLVQASAFHGRITEVYVLWPWSQPGRMPASKTGSFTDTMYRIVMALTSALALLFAAFLAARNLRAGRGDRKGARRLTIAIALFTAIAWITSAHWVTDIAMADFLFFNACQWFAAAALMWLFYIALEPAVRARWPHAIVTWNRVLAGRWNDPLVGAHVLFGALTGLAITYLFILNGRFEFAHGRIGSTEAANAGMDVRHFIDYIAELSREAVQAGLVVIFAIFCLRVVFRKAWIASIAAAVLFTLREAEVWRNGNPVVFFGYVAVFTLLAFVLLRLGLLSSIVAIFVVNVLMNTPAPQDLTHWYEWSVVAYPAIIMAMVLWAFWRTSGEQALAET